MSISLYHAFAKRAAERLQPHTISQRSPWEVKVRWKLLAKSGCGGDCLRLLLYLRAGLVAGLDNRALLPDADRSDEPVCANKRIHLAVGGAVHE